MRLFALSAGIEAPTERFSGIVHSVFVGACNIGLETGALLTLVSSKKTNVPHGLRIETPARFAFPDFVRVGEPAACRGGTVRFARSALSIDLRTAVCWHIDLSGLRIDLHRRGQAAAWTVAWHTLRRHRRGNTIAEIIAAMAQAEGAFRTVPALFETTGALQAEAACNAIEPLIGLGPDLTPAGDMRRSRSRGWRSGWIGGIPSTASARKHGPPYRSVTVQGPTVWQDCCSVVPPGQGPRCRPLVAWGFRALDLVYNYVFNWATEHTRCAVTQSEISR
jgi:hypothetical protein